MLKIVIFYICNTRIEEGRNVKIDVNMEKKNKDTFTAINSFISLSGLH